MLASTRATMAFKNQRHGMAPSDDRVAGKNLVPIAARLQFNCARRTTLNGRSCKSSANMPVTAVRFRGGKEIVVIGIA